MFHGPIELVPIPLTPGAPQDRIDLSPGGRAPDEHDAFHGPRDRPPRDASRHLVHKVFQPASASSGPSAWIIDRPRAYAEQSSDKEGWVHVRQDLREGVTALDPRPKAAPAPSPTPDATA